MGEDKKTRQQGPIVFADGTYNIPNTKGVNADPSVEHTVRYKDTVLGCHREETYVNLSDGEICVCDRNGTLLILPSKGKGKSIIEKSLFFRIIVRYTLSREMAYKYIALAEHSKEIGKLISSSATKTQELKTVVKELKRKIQEDKASGKQRKQFTVILTYDISRKDMTYKDSYFQTHGFYVYNYDIVLSPSHSPVLHSKSTSLDTNSAIRKTMEEYEHPSMLFCLDIIDNEGILQPRYIRVGNIVHKITPRQSTEEKNGVYIHYNTVTLDENGDPGLLPEIAEKKCLTYSEADKILGLFLTYEEAWFNGDESLRVKKSSDAAKLEITRMEVQMAELEKSNKKLTHKLSKAKLEADHLKSKLDVAKKEVEYETADIKHRTQARSSRTTEWSDTTKMIAAGAVAVASIVGAIYATKK